MKNSVKIGIIGDYESERPSHIATNESIRHCAKYLGIDVEIEWLPTESFENGKTESLQAFDGLWCAPGSPYKSMMGAIHAINFARENNYPFIGTCGGFQHAVMEYAYNKLGYKEIGEKSYNPYTSELFISPLSCSLVGETRIIKIHKDSKIYQIYLIEEKEERFNCSFGLNPKYQRLINDNGFRVVGTDESGEARILELNKNDFFIATLFQPQLSSTESNPHKLILSFLIHATKSLKN
ncbi:MAG: synthase [Anaerocolumna sp.]|jgi:CTP synthase (UTP-ammonia lyase)|nr:synthase [Anaerocolumna sp.]